jgi:hypothetical protein
MNGKPRLTAAEKRNYAVKIKEQDLNARLNSSFCRNEDLAMLQQVQESRPSEPPHKRLARMRAEAAAAAATSPRQKA